MLGFIVVFLLLCVIVGVYVGSAYLAAYLDVRSRPREEMVWCNKHGFFRKGFALPFGPTLYCPQCYLEKLQPKK